MGLVIVLAELAASIFLIRGAIRHFRSRRASRAWWTAAAIAAALGVLFGIGLALRGEIQVSKDTRFVSLPLPLAVFRKEGDHWTDFVTPPYVMYPGIVANSMAITSVFTSAAWLVSAVTNRKLRGPEASGTPP